MPKRANFKYEEENAHELFAELRRRGVTANNYNLDRANKLKDGSWTLFFNSTETDYNRLLINSFKECRPAQKLPIPKQSMSKKIIMVEPTLFYDVHLGLLSWAAETRHNYDLKIAVKNIKSIAKKIASKYANKNVDYFLLTVGNDFFHINDDFYKTPTSGHNLEHDGRFMKIFDTGFQLYLDIIYTFASIAKVKIRLVPGNHDKLAGPLLCRILSEHFRSVKGVEIDGDLHLRKFEKYGNNIICLTHSDGVRLNDINNLIMNECPYDTRGYNTEVHMGHRHHEAIKQMQTLDGQGHIVYRYMPTIVSKDLYHTLKGYSSGLLSHCYEWAKDDLTTIRRIRS